MNILKANKEHVRYIKENKYLTLQGAETTGYMYTIKYSCRDIYVNNPLKKLFKVFSNNYMFFYIDKKDREIKKIKQKTIFESFIDVIIVVKRTEIEKTDSIFYNKSLL